MINTIPDTLYYNLFSLVVQHRENVRHCQADIRCSTCEEYVTQTDLSLRYYLVGNTLNDGQ